MSIEIVPLSRVEIPEAVECVQRAFADDPYFRWAFNDPAKVRDTSSHPGATRQTMLPKTRACGNPNRDRYSNIHLLIVQRPPQRSFPRGTLPIRHQLQLPDLSRQDKPCTKRPEIKSRTQITSRDYCRRGLVVSPASILQATDLVNLGAAMAPLLPAVGEQYPFPRPRRVESIPVLDLEGCAAGGASDPVDRSAGILFLQYGRC